MILPAPSIDASHLGGSGGKLSQKFGQILL